jgi:hypothetical protein
VGRRRADTATKVIKLVWRKNGKSGFENRNREVHAVMLVDTESLGRGRRKGEETMVILRAHFHVIMHTDTGRGFLSILYTESGGIVLDIRVMMAEG